MTQELGPVSPPFPWQHDNSIIGVNSTKKGKVSECVCGGEAAFLRACSEWKEQEFSVKSRTVVSSLSKKTLDLQRKQGKERCGRTVLECFRC